MKRIINILLLLLICVCGWSQEIVIHEDSLVYVNEDHVGGTIVVKNANGFSCELHAIANEGYTFLQWSDGNVLNPRHYTQIKSEEADKEIWAVFTRNDDMTQDNGHIEVSVDSPTTPSFFLEAKPTSPATFYKWDNGESTAKISYVESDGTRYPFYSSDNGELIFTYLQRPGGIVSATNVNGVNCDLVATANDGYTFQQWADGDTQNPRPYTHGGDETEDEIVWAVFTKDEDMVSNGGTISVTIDDADIPSYELTVNLYDGVEFYKWDNGEETTTIKYNESDGNRYPFFMSDNGTMIFEYDQHPGGIVEAKDIDGVNYNLVATANSGYTFLQWADGDTRNPRPYTHGGDETEDEIAFAVFTKNSDMVSNGGTISVGIDHEDVPDYELTINLYDGVTFYKWDNGEETTTIKYQESDGNRYPFFKSLDGILTFDFIQHPGGIVSVKNVSDLELDLVARPNDGYRFEGWADDLDNKDTVRHYTHGGDETEDEIAFAVFARIEDVEQESGVTLISVTNETTPEFELAPVPGTCSDFLMWYSGETDSLISYVETDGTKIPFFDIEDQVLVEQENSIGGEVIVTPGPCNFTLEAIATPGWHFTHWKDDKTLGATRIVEYEPYDSYYANFMKSAFKVGDEYYSTFDEAQGVASETTPIEIVNDVLESLVVTKPIAIDGNGHIFADLTIKNGGSVKLNSALKVNTLYLNTTTGSSAQLKDYETKLTYTNAYLDITWEAGQDKASPDKWYGFSVPFEVDVENGIARASGNGAHQSGTDYLVWEYDGTLRSNTGNGWIKMMGGTLEPGKFYMIGIDGDENTWRFTKKQGSNLGGNRSVTLPAFSGSLIDGGWNAIGNGTVQYAKAAIEDIPFVQVYDNINSAYIVKMTDLTSFVVACPFFAQVAGENTMVLTASNETSALYAPQRTTERNEIFQVQFGDETYQDALYLAAKEDASTTYEIGHDLAKMSILSTLPQIFTYDYGVYLCAQESPIVNGSAIFPLFLMVPKLGQYTLSLSGCNREVTLLKDNQPIADITNGEYTIPLNRGMNVEYQLLVGDVYNAPTRNENVQTDYNAQKILFNQHIYIRTGERLYDATGCLVR